MSADDQNIRALREAGHDDAADLLEQVAWHRARAEAEAKPADQAPPPAIRLLDAGPADAQRRREGETLLAGMRAAGIGAGWVSGGELMGGDR